MRGRLLAAGFIVGLAALAQATFAQTSPATPAAAPSDAAGSAGLGFFKNVGGFDRIQSDNVNYNFETGNFSLPDRFTAVRQGTEITADRATGNSKRKQLHAEGHVIVHNTRPLSHNGQANDVAQKPSTLTCDKLDADGVKQLYIATGNVHFTQEKRDATSDVATLDDLNHHLHMEGHVHIAQGEQTLDAEALDYDTKSGDMHAQNNVTIVAPIPTASAGPATPQPSGKPKKRRLL